MKMQLEINGVKELQQALKELSDLEPIKDVIKMNTAEVQNKAQRLVPVDTGNLKRSIVMEVSSSGLEGRVSTNMEYALPVEYGTRFQSSQPFMKPSIAEQTSRFKSDIVKAIKIK